MSGESTSAGATPAAAGATPVQSQPAGQPDASSAAPTPGPATGDELGEAGKKAIAAERKAAKEAQDALKAAQDELEALRATTLTDQEKALNAAKREAAAEVSAKYDSKLIRADLRGRLKAAGMANDALVELALKSDAFAGVKLDEEGRVIDGDKLIEALKKETPELFATPAGPGNGTVTAGAQTGAPVPPKDLESAILAHYTKR
jgi:hypothetical protein